MSSGECRDTSEVDAFQATRSKSRSPVGSRVLIVAGTGKQRASWGVQSEMVSDQWGWSLRQATTYGCQHTGKWVLPIPLSVARTEVPPFRSDKTQRRAVYQDECGWAVRKRASHMAWRAVTWTSGSRKPTPPSRRGRLPTL